MSLLAQDNLPKQAKLKAARERFIPFKKYVDIIKSSGVSNFYTADQNYVHAMIMIAEMDYVELHAGWNSFIHMYYVDASKKTLKTNDSRTEDTKFVHIQLRCADHWDAATQHRIANLPKSEWNI